MDEINWTNQLEAYLEERVNKSWPNMNAQERTSYKLGYLKSVFASELASRPDMAHEVTQRFEFAIRYN